MQRLAIVLGLLMLAACTYTYRWSRPPEATEREFQRDHSTCARDAEVASHGFAGTNPWTQYEGCMSTKGYKKTGGSWEF